jgi:O-antigen ligase
MSERLVFGYGTSRHTGVAPERAPAPAEGPPILSSHEPAGVVARRDGQEGAFVGLLVFTAVLYLRPQDHITILRVVPLAEIAALGALAAMVFGRLSSGLNVTRYTPDVAGVALLGLLMLATAPFSIWPGGAVATFSGLYMKAVLIYLLMVTTLTSPTRIARFTWLIVLASGYISFRAVFDYARGVNLIENDRVRGAIGGMFQNPNDLALNMVAVLPLAIFVSMRASGTVGRLFGAACALLMTGAVVASHSRSGTVGLGMVAVFLAWRLVRIRPGLIAVGVLAMLLALPLVPGSYWSRMSSITDESRDETGSREARRLLLGEAWAAFLANPLTGVGAGQFRNYAPEGRAEPWRETHNVLLQVAAELGVIGLGIFMFLIYRAAMAGRATHRMLRRTAGGERTARSGGAPPPHPTPATADDDDADFFRSYAVMVTAALAGWFFCALFASVAYHWTFYYLLALAGAPRQILADRLAVSDAARRAWARTARLQEARV